MTRIFFDCEFMDDGRTLELLSLGAVRSDGREFYAVNSEADLTRANPWVQQHVIPHLGQFPRSANTEVIPAARATRADIAEAFREFVPQVSNWRDLQFWGYYCDYDWVLVCQLFGRMVDLPSGWPKFAYDLRQGLDMRGLPGVRQADEAVHHALLDARWVRDAYAKHLLTEEESDRSLPAFMEEWDKRVKAGQSSPVSATEYGMLQLFEDWQRNPSVLATT